MSIQKLFYLPFKSFRYLYFESTKYEVRRCEKVDQLFSPKSFDRDRVHLRQSRQAGKGSGNQTSSLALSRQINFNSIKESARLSHAQDRSSLFHLHATNIIIPTTITSLLLTSTLEDTGTSFRNSILKNLDIITLLFDDKITIKSTSFLLAASPSPSNKRHSCSSQAPTCHHVHQVRPRSPPPSPPKNSTTLTQPLPSQLGNAHPNPPPNLHPPRQRIHPLHLPPTNNPHPLLSQHLPRQIPFLPLLLDRLPLPHKPSNHLPPVDPHYLTSILRGPNPEYTRLSCRGALDRSECLDLSCAACSGGWVTERGIGNEGDV